MFFFYFFWKKNKKKIFFPEKKKFNLAIMTHKAPVGHRVSPESSSNDPPPIVAKQNLEDRALRSPEIS